MIDSECNDTFGLRDFLVGETVKRIEVGSGERLMRIYTDRGLHTLEAWGDCCSESWFAELIGVQSLLGHKVTDVDGIRLPQVDDGRTRQDVDEWYGVQIATERGGVCKLVFRNSSNGYYGGGLQVIDNDSNYAHADKWTNITDDWTAYE